MSNKRTLPFYLYQVRVQVFFTRLPCQFILCPVEWSVRVHKASVWEINRLVSQLLSNVLHLCRALEQYQFSSSEPALSARSVPASISRFCVDADLWWHFTRKVMRLAGGHNGFSNKRNIAVQTIKYGKLMLKANSKIIYLFNWRQFKNYILYIYN